MDPLQNFYHKSGLGTRVTIAIVDEPASQLTLQFGVGVGIPRIVSKWM